MGSMEPEAPKHTGTVTSGARAALEGEILQGRGEAPRGGDGPSSLRWGGDNCSLQGPVDRLRARGSQGLGCVRGAPPQCPRPPGRAPGSRAACGRTGVSTEGCVVLEFTHRRHGYGLRNGEARVRVCWDELPVSALTVAHPPWHSCRERRRRPGRGLCAGPRGLRAGCLLASVILHSAMLPFQSRLPMELSGLHPACCKASL